MFKDLQDEGLSYFPMFVGCACCFDDFTSEFPSGNLFVIIVVHVFSDSSSPLKSRDFSFIPIGSMYAIYDNIYHQYTPNVSIYTRHGSYGI